MTFGLLISHLQFPLICGRGAYSLTSVIKNWGPILGTLIEKKTKLAGSYYRFGELPFWFYFFSLSWEIFFKKPIRKKTLLEKKRTGGGNLLNFLKKVYLKRGGGGGLLHYFLWVKLCGTQRFAMGTMIAKISWLLHHTIGFQMERLFQKGGDLIKRKTNLLLKNRAFGKKTLTPNSFSQVYFWNSCETHFCQAY